MGLALLLCAVAPGAAQRSIATERDTLRFELADLRVMLDTARALYKDLEEDPAVLYSLGFGPPAQADAADAAYPWNAISPTSDSTVNVIMPGNLREADRAYYNYAVLRMRVVRGQDPDAGCDELVEAEHAVLSGYVDGWILARTLFGGPAFAPLDELAFAREAGLLRPLLAARGDRSIGVCASEWAAQHPEEIREYETWRTAAFPDLAGAVSGPDTMPAESDNEATGEDLAGS
jgi:hypothetical protein